jgi:hypothetical protein
LKQGINLLVMLNVYHMPAIFNNGEFRSWDAADNLLAMGSWSQAIRVTDDHKHLCMLEYRQGIALVMI